ncbi:MAG: amidohydrolase family protein, partial [Thermoleophilia bacterium]|nr:amidohydrolase family protein [Thermoleophilia bacterium]
MGMKPFDRTAGSGLRVTVALSVVVMLIAAISAGAATASFKHRHGHQPAADTVLRDGFVYTVDDRDSVADAIAVKKGKILYVGSNRGARRYIGRGTDVVDLDDRMVMPGIIDGHIHDIIDPAQPTCDLGGGPLTIPEFRALVAACLDDPALHTAAPGAPDDFLVIDGFYAQFLRPAGTMPTKALFEGLTDRPIFANFAVTTHGGLVNQAALDLAGIDASTPDPPGGHILKGPDGEPNGFLADFPASGLVSSLIPPPPPLTLQEQVDLAASRMKTFSEKGVTGFYIPGSRLAPVFQELREQHGLTARAHFGASVARGLPIDTPEGREAYLAQAEQVRDEIEKRDQLPWQVYSWRPGAEKEGPRLVAEPGVAIPGVKLLDDGIIQHPTQTAAMLEPYLDESGVPRTDPNARGFLAIESDALNPLVKGLTERGFQSHIHAIGDRGVRTTLDAFESAKRWNPKLERRSRPTIAHAELVDPADIPRFARLNVTASMGLQWAKPAPDSTEAVMPYVGPERWNYYEPSGWITNAGGRV